MSKKTELGASDDLARVKYWNENYVNYWKARVAEANASGVGASVTPVGDVKTTADALYLSIISLLDIQADNRVLELGCGFGRSLPTLSAMAAEVSAVDISEQMIRAAQEACTAPNVHFYVSPSEALPLPSGAFERVVCFAAFDAMYQTEALVEMHRVTADGGKILITGKNDNYRPDDIKALEAEAGARGKGHPNYFTDVVALLKHIDRFGFAVEKRRFFERRGDFSDDQGKELPPPHFYEYLLVLKKTGECDPPQDIAFCNAMSRTFANQASKAK